MEKLISYLLIGTLVSSFFSSCEKDVEDGNDYPPEQGSYNIRNIGENPIDIIWYAKGGDRVDTMSFPMKSDVEINPNYIRKPSVDFDSISILCNSKMITFVPIAIENVELPRVFSLQTDEAKSSSSFAYEYCTLSESSLSDIAKEMESHGQNVWRKK